ncbi:hypothetical protein [Ruegeria halocynthiae]|nr:hypothetical protein [Ruegeria halocynthiae]
MEEVKYRNLSPTSEQRLNFDGQGRIKVGTKIKGFVFGKWPEFAKTHPPLTVTSLSVMYGKKQNFDWANAFLLRVDPASYSWLTNGELNGIVSRLNMGSGAILLSFEEPICAFGSVFSQAGAHNRHHPHLRKRTSFTFIDESGYKIDRFDLLPGAFIVESAFQTRASDNPIWAVVVDAEVPFALIELVAKPCTLVID